MERPREKRIAISPRGMEVQCPFADKCLWTARPPLRKRAPIERDADRAIEEAEEIDGIAVVVTECPRRDCPEWGTLTASASTEVRFQQAE